MSLRSFSAAAAVAALAFAAAPSAMASATTPTARLASPASTQATAQTSTLPNDWFAVDRNFYVCQSSNYHSLFVFQDDGNLVDYDETGRARWSSRTDGRDTWYAHFSDNGGLKVIDHLGQSIWWNNVGNAYNYGAYIVCQDDGNVVIYNANKVALWSTRTVH